MDPVDSGRGLAYPHGPGLKAIIQARLAAFPRLELAAPGLRRAGVALALVRGPEGEAVFLLTRRSAGLRSHRGQRALPGGRLLEGETAEQAAIRELAEELRPSAGFEVLGRLDDYRTRSGYLITPVVAWCDAPDLTVDPDPGEVDTCTLVPLAELDRPNSPEWLAPLEPGTRMIRVRILDFGVQAPTGAILHQFREVVMHGRLARIDDIDQPEFARR